MCIQYMNACRWMETFSIGKYTLLRKSLGSYYKKLLNRDIIKL